MPTQTKTKSTTERRTVPSAGSGNTGTTGAVESATGSSGAVGHKAAEQYRRAERPVNEPDWELIQNYLPLVKSIVSRMRIYFSSHVDMDDIYSVGVSGLISAVQRYDASKGKSFSAYASLRVRGAILDELRRIDWMPRSSRANAKMLRRTIEELELQLNRPAKEEEIREKLGLSSREYALLLQQVRPISFVPIDESPNPEDPEGPAIQEAISDATEMDAREKCESRETIELIRDRIESLPEVPRKVLCMYYFENMRLAEIAAVFGLTEARICQIHTQAVISLRSYLNQVQFK